MTDFLFQLGLSNVLISLVLAIIALLAGTFSRRPQLLYLLWLIVLVKLVTPSLVTIPVVTIPEQNDNAVVSMQDYSHDVTGFTEIKGDAVLSAETLFAALDHRVKELSMLWLLGSVLVFAVSLARIYRFNRLLREESEIAPLEFQADAASIAKRLGLKTAPTIYTTTAHMSPMVWWIGGKVRVVIPAALHHQMDARQFQLILAHELAHLRRRDHLVRWIEWLACVGFWWNPVVWFARRNLRANEELCCDALVVSSLEIKSQKYADSLLKAVEFIASPVIHPPVMASEFNSGGLLKRRFTMIASGKLTQTNSRWLQACVLLCAVVVLPLGMSCNKDNVMNDPKETTEDAMLHKAAEQPVENRTEIDIDIEALGRRIRAAVDSGEITPEEGRARMEKTIQEIATRSKGKIELDAIKEQLDAAVEAGEITREQADARLAGLMERMTADEDGVKNHEGQSDGDIKDIGLRIRAAIERGEMTPEEGRAKMEYVRQKMAIRTKLDRDDGVDWRTAKSTAPEDWPYELKAQIEAAGYDLNAISEKLHPGKRKAESIVKITRDGKGIKYNLDDNKRRLNGFVEAGKITREEADAMLKVLKEFKMMIQRYNPEKD